MEEIDLKEFFKILLSKIWLILLVGVIFGASVYSYSKFIKVPLYEATTTLVLTKTTGDQTTINQNDITVNQKLVYTYSELVKSEKILSTVIKNLELDYTTNELAKEITVQTVDNTEILKIIVRDKDREESSIIANETAKVFKNEINTVYEINNISIIDTAKVPKDVCNNTTTRDTILGTLLGMFIVIVIILIIFYFDDTIKYSENLEEDIKLPIIGKIMLERKKDRIELVVKNKPKDVISEEIKTIRTNLAFSSVDKDLRTILITSTESGEGKSYISANLATAFSQSGKNVLLVDCDMRKGRQNKIFGVPNDLGLSNLAVANIENFSKYIRPIKVKRLSLLTCGTVPPNPSEILESNKTKELIEKLKEIYDIIIFDGPPVSGLPDSVIMSTLVDKAIIVTSERKTQKEALKSVRKSLQSVGAEIAGVIVNKVHMTGLDYYRDKYYYGEKKKNGRHPFSRNK